MSSSSHINPNDVISSSISSSISSPPSPSPSPSSPLSPSACFHPVRPLPNIPRQTVTSTASALIIAASDKAGMEGIDRTRIDSIILRESANSNFMSTQLKRDAAVDRRIEAMKRRLAARSDDDGSTPSDSEKGWRRAIERTLTPEIDRLRSARRATSTCVVVDMDAFYINCEMLTRPHLRTVPACVGINLITTSNYPARRYGVRSAMAGWIGDTLVAEISKGKHTLVHIKSNFQLYNEKAAIVREVLSVYDPNMRAYSLEEVYLDLARYLEMMLIRGWDHHRIVNALKQSHQDNTATDADADDVDADAIQIKDK